MIYNLTAWFRVFEAPAAETITDLWSDSYTEEPVWPDAEELRSDAAAACGFSMPLVGGSLLH